MKKRVGLIGSIVLGAATVIVGLSGGLAAAQSTVDGLTTTVRPVVVEPLRPILDPKPVYRVPESSSLILLGAGFAGLALWTWRKRSTKI